MRVAPARDRGECANVDELRQTAGSPSISLRGMNKHLIHAALVLCCATAGTAWSAAGNKALEAPAANKGPITKQQYEAGQKAIEAQLDTDQKACERLKGDAQDVCEAQAKGRHKAEKAKLEARYKPSPDTVEEARLAVADANFEVAKEKCGAMKGTPKSRCMKEAKAAREAARRHARVEKVDSTGGIFGEGGAGKAAAKAPKS